MGFLGGWLTITQTWNVHFKPACCMVWELYFNKPVSKIQDNFWQVLCRHNKPNSLAWPFGFLVQSPRQPNSLPHHQHSQFRCRSWKWSVKNSSNHQTISGRLGTFGYWTEVNFLCGILLIMQDSLVAQRVKHIPAMQETQVRSLGQEDPLEKEMATHSSTLA